eukprot:TRINITY_DN20213_c0_g7_i1.p1 TRINITY_DN20213_c0_g7~~TRINITY_DN20213_c0_g7_i1.p1  ORF type:complete len:708 (-),score=76.02 TRINITY_DN20213_c0_g7_i1:206-2299(-)
MAKLLMLQRRCCGHDWCRGPSAITSALGFALLLGLVCSAATGTSELQTVDGIVARARSLLERADADAKKLGRGYLSLALHLDPFFPEERSALGSWAAGAAKDEPRQYWAGNVYVGHDKTQIEALIGNPNTFSDERKSGSALITWRGLQLTGLSCCGIDNMAVYFAQNNRHMYVAPFVDLVPGYGKRLTEANQPMYNSFREWWESSGRRPMPHPQVQYKGNGRFEWAPMKVVMRTSRIPDAWKEMIQAVLLYRFKLFEEARVCALAAIRKNSELASDASAILPDLRRLTPAQAVHGFATDTKYVICYNPHVGLGNVAVVMASALALARITGRTLLLDWNANKAIRHAFDIRQQPDVALLESAALGGLKIAPSNVRNIYFFHMMYSPDLGSVLELFGCSDTRAELDKHPVVTLSSNMYFAPLLGINPHVESGSVPSFPDLLLDLTRPGEEAAHRALEYAKSVQWGKSVPVVAVHIRAKEDGADNDDWPTANSPSAAELQKLRDCTEMAVAREFKTKGGWLWGESPPEWDVFIASTTEKARSAVAKVLKGAKGLRNILLLPDLLRNRGSQKGTVDAMAEALLISRADIFMRLVVGTSGFSTFAYLSNALRRQNDWVKAAPELKLERAGFAPNYLVTSSCGPGRCFVAPPEVRAANIAWHGSEHTHRSCGDVLGKAEKAGARSLGCQGNRPIDVQGHTKEL